MPNGDVKISAARLIQHSGFDRGYRKGTVGLSPHHPLILINGDGASAREILDFAAEMQQRILNSFGVLLKPEVRLIGFSSSPFIE
jgi:UDP-N-acetylmuramate dehydrogenase